MTTGPDIAFDDIDGLTGRVSEDYGAWGPEVEVSQAMIDQFAELTGDDQWIHTDVERCQRESPFGGPIAHGFLTLSLLGAMRPPTGFAITGYKNVINYGSSGLRFLAPVPAGATIHARRRLVSVEAHPKGTRLTTEVAVHVVGSDRPSLVYTGLALYQ
jgi:hypothetical protein